MAVNPSEVTKLLKDQIKTPDDAALVAGWGADAVLVGESLMRADDVNVAVNDIMNSMPN